MGTAPLASVDIDQVEMLARSALRAASNAELRLAAAESCTGGFISSLLSGVEGLGHSFDCGFVVYSDEAKSLLLGIDPEKIERHGAVSKSVAIDMARGAVAHSKADIAIATTGFTGHAPPGKNGLVHFAVADRDGNFAHRQHHFGEVERDEGRLRAAAEALGMLNEHLVQMCGK